MRAAEESLEMLLLERAEDATCPGLIAGNRCSSSGLGSFPQIIIDDEALVSQRIWMKLARIDLQMLPALDTSWIHA